jgi:hypothetical protein
MKSITRYLLIAVAVVAIGAITKPSESEHRSKLTTEIVRHNLGDYGRELRSHRQQTGDKLTKSEYVKENYDINIDDYLILSLGKIKDKSTGEERVVSIASLGKVFIK